MTNACSTAWYAANRKEIAERRRQVRAAWSDEQKAIHRARRRKHARRHREEERARSAEYQRENREALLARQRAHDFRVRLERMYGLTRAKYIEMLQQQGGLCAICKMPERRRYRNGALYAMSVDHNHSTGRVRSLLCGRCNSLLGQSNDRPWVLRAAATYLESHAPEVLE